MDLAKLQGLVKARQDELEARKTSGTQLAKIPAGSSRWRILPGWRPADRETYYHDFGQHWIKDGEGKVTAVIVSERDTFGREDATADIIWGAIRNARDEDTKKRLKELTSRRMVLVNAVQIAGAGADPAKVVLMGLPNGLATKFHALLMSRLEDGINILDLDKGRDVVIGKSGTGLNTEYTMVDAAKETKVEAALMEQAINIDAFIEGERQKGLQKGVGPVNEAIAHALGGAGSAVATARSSLTSVLPSAAAAAVTLAPVVATAAVAAPVTVAVAPVVATAAVAAASSDLVDDEELKSLLASIEQ